MMWSDLGKKSSKDKRGSREFPGCFFLSVLQELPAIVRRGHPDNMEEQLGEVLGILQADFSGDLGQSELCLFHQVDRPVDPVYVDIIPGGYIHIPGEQAAQIPGGDMQLTGDILKQNLVHIVSLDIIQSKGHIFLLIFRLRLRGGAGFAGAQQFQKKAEKEGVDIGGGGVRPVETDDRSHSIGQFAVGCLLVAGRTGEQKGMDQIHFRPLSGDDLCEQFREEVNVVKGAFSVSGQIKGVDYIGKDHDEITLGAQDRAVSDLHSALPFSDEVDLQAGVKMFAEGVVIGAVLDRGSGNGICVKRYMGRPDVHADLSSVKSNLCCVSFTYYKTDIRRSKHIVPDYTKNRIKCDRLDKHRNTKMRYNDGHGGLCILT